MSEISRLHGFTVSAPFPMGPRSERRTIDWEVSYAGEARAGLGATGQEVIVAQAGNDPAFYRMIEHDPERFTFQFLGLADVEIDTANSRILIHTAAGADHRRIPLLMAGTVMAAVCQLAGHLVLHASAVEIGGSAVAFAGDSGAGKSTMAALACIGGARLVTDDVLRVDNLGTSSLCYRGATSLRLRDRSRILVAGHEATSVSPDGRHLLVPPPAPHEALPLGRILMPRVDGAADAASVRRLDVHSATLALLGAPRIRGWKHSSAPQLFDRLVDLAATVPVYELSMPAGFHADRRAAESINDMITRAVD